MRVPANKISLPIPDLDDKTFDELFVEARALIPRYAPEWTDHNTSDSGITFLELFAWLTEMQIYSLNRINDKNSLKYFKLLGEAPRPAKPAKVNLVFSVDKYRTEPVIIKKGVQAFLVDPVSDQPLVFEVDADLTVTNIRIAHLFVDDTTRFIDITQENKNNGVYAFAFGENALSNSAFYIAFAGADQFPEAEISLFYLVYDADLPDLIETETPPDIVPSAQLQWQYWSGSAWVLLDAIDETASLTRNGRIRFQGNNKFKKATLKTIIPGVINANQEEFFWFRAVVRKTGFEIPPRINTLIVNAVNATQKQTITDEIIQNSEIERQGLPHQTASLTNKPVLADTLQLEIKEEDNTWQQWAAVSDFDASGPNDRHYTINLKEGLIRFGNGLKGRIPPQDINNEANIRASHFQAGGGENGNVKAQTIQAILSSEITAVKVDNPLPAFGGVQTETLETAQHRIRKDLTRPYRTVNSDDFAAMAFETPGLRLQRVKVLPLYHPEYPAIKMPGVVTVIVIPFMLPSQSGLPIPSQGFLQTVYNYLEPRRLVATQLFVIKPIFVSIKITASIEIEAGKSSEILRGTIKEALNKYFDPVEGGDDSKGWPFGRDVYRSEIYQVLQNLEGIHCVKTVALSAEKRFSKENGDISIPKIGLVDLVDCSIAISGEENG
jgi:predicted phage baseplate assembly protein